jgi:hypothetical protein
MKAILKNHPLIHRTVVRFVTALAYRIKATSSLELEGTARGSLLVSCGTKLERIIPGHP